MGILSSIGKLIGTAGSVAAGSLIPGKVGNIISSGLSSLAGSVSDSQNFENQMKLQMQGQQWQEHMVDKQNQWNSAPEQAKRYREAGINPAMALGNGQSGIVSSGGSSGINSSLPVHDSGVISNEQHQFQLQKELTHSEVNRNNADAARSQAEADTENRNRILKTLGIMKQNNLIDSQTARNKAESIVFGNQSDFYEQTRDSAIERVHSALKQDIYREVILSSEGIIASANAGVIDKEISMRFATAAGNIILAAKQGNMYDAMSAAQQAGAYLSTVMARNQDYTEEQRVSLLEATVSSIKSAAAQAGIDTSYREFDHIMDLVTKGIGNVIGLGKLGLGIKASKAAVGGASDASKAAASALFK